MRVQLRGEFLNSLNKANFGLPGANVTGGANFGVTNIAADPRILQLGARLRC